MKPVLGLQAFQSTGSNGYERAQRALQIAEQEIYQLAKENDNLAYLVFEMDVISSDLERIYLRDGKFTTSEDDDDDDNDSIKPLYSCI